MQVREAENKSKQEMIEKRNKNLAHKEALLQQIKEQRARKTKDGIDMNQNELLINKPLIHKARQALVI